MNQLLRDGLTILCRFDLPSNPESLEASVLVAKVSATELGQEISRQTERCIELFLERLLELFQALSKVVVRLRANWRCRRRLGRRERGRQGDGDAR